MIVEELSPTEYKKRLQNVHFGFNKMEFCEYNKGKVDSVRYLLIRDDKKERFVVPFGINGKSMKAPFSATYSIIGEISKKTSVEYYRPALRALGDYARENGIEEIQISFPPYFYDMRAISYWKNAAFLENWHVAADDLNFAIDLLKVREKGYDKLLSYSGRYTLKQAISCGNSFHLCELKDERSLAYAINKRNKEEHSYPLHMTEEQVEWTMGLFNGKWYLVRNEGVGIASALVFEVYPKIAQVVYWGSIGQYNKYYPMNFLCDSLVKVYSDQGFQYMDIGISTEDSVPNEGLCIFKENIGCDVSSKLTMKKEIR